MDHYIDKYYYALNKKSNTSVKRGHAKASVPAGTLRFGALWDKAEENAVLRENFAAIIGRTGARFKKMK